MEDADEAHSLLCLSGVENAGNKDARTSLCSEEHPARWRAQQTGDGSGVLPRDKQKISLSCDFVLRFQLLLSWWSLSSLG